MTRNAVPHRLRIATAMAGLLVVTGCAVNPQPAERDALDEEGQANVAALGQAQNSIEHPLRPSEAIARALLHNRERRVKAMQAALKSRQLDAAEFEMLPSLTARAGYTERSDYAATESVPFVDNEPQGSPGSDTYSISREKERTTYGIEFTWSILDFGLSYVRAQQKADQYLIAQEQERKAVENLARDVRAAYWKAVSADRLLDKVGPLMTRVNQALERSKQIERERLSAPMDALSYQRSLLDIKRSLGSLREELIGSNKRLARLMGLPPDTAIPLPDYANQDFEIPELPLDVATMERTALVLRPEIRTAEYKQRIARKEVRAAFLKMFPDLSLSAGYQYDDNRYLRYSDWSSAGVAVSWDLLNVFKVARERKAAEVGTEVARERRLATSLAVLTQIHLAVKEFHHSQRKLDTAKDYLDVSRGIATLVERQEDSDSGGRLQVIKEQLNSLVAELRRDLAYAQIQNNYARLFNSIGLNPYPSEAEEPARLAAAIEARQDRWQDGHIAVVIQPISEQEPRLTADEQGVPTFRIAADTFSLAGDVHYRARRADGRPLPDWLAFDPATRTFRATDPDRVEAVRLAVRAESPSGVYARDRFMLQPGDTT